MIREFEVKAIVADAFARLAEEKALSISLATPFVDIGLDSFALMEVFLDIEERIGEVPAEVLEELAASTSPGEFQEILCRACALL